MFRKGVAIGYREPAIDAVLRGGKGIDALRAKAEALQRRLAAERAMDSVLADSFPASDPPSWTLGIAHPPERQATNAETVAPDADRAASVRQDVIDGSRPGTRGRTFVKGVVSLAGAAGIALLVPVVMLLIGVPIALAVRGAVEAAGWLLALICE